MLNIVLKELLRYGINAKYFIASNYLRLLILIKCFPEARVPHAYGRLFHMIIRRWFCLMFCTSYRNFLIITGAYQIIARQKFKKCRRREIFYKFSECLEKVNHSSFSTWLVSTILTPVAQSDAVFSTIV